MKKFVIEKGEQYEKATECNKKVINELLKKEFHSLNELLNDDLVHRIGGLRITQERNIGFESLAKTIKEWPVYQHYSGIGDPYGKTHEIAKIKVKYIKQK